MWQTTGEERESEGEKGESEGAEETEQQTNSTGTDKAAVFCDRSCQLPLTPSCRWVRGHAPPGMLIFIRRNLVKSGTFSHKHRLPFILSFKAFIKA